jgi:catechol 2,3-dioxygenase-like lactoylglutathione lyase family enzyme
MSRLQLALTVRDIDEAVAFYATVFGTEPAKRRPGYANFAIADPPLKLVLIEGEQGGTLNHLGVEVDTTEEVHAATGRFQAADLPVRLEDGVECCYALQDKVWVNDPDGAEWEWYTVLGDSSSMASTAAAASTEAAECCAPAEASTADSACC